MILSVVEVVILCFFFNDTATTEIYTLSLHDALPIAQSKLEHGGILATADRLIVAAPAADLLEPHRQVQTDRSGVGGPYLEKRGSHAGGGRPLDQGAEQALADAAAAKRLAPTQIQEVRLARTDAHDAGNQTL